MRSYNRLSMDKEIACRVDGERRYVTLYNLSSGGCMIECFDRIEEGSRVDLDISDTVPMTGHVVWRIEKNAGIKFDVPLHTAAVEALGYALAGEDFDQHDPRDRFGIPLVGNLHRAAGTMR
ncbi:PilZ domain-containing protein [Erythrobacteraceae bacterium WH01K]|nr:PilZ domain-containing protein [Erythrobacteraceae bacterium WH01K]